MPYTPTQFYAAFPAFVDERVGDVQRHIDAVASEFDEVRWGAQFEQGIGNLVAHRLVIERARATDGGNDRGGISVGGVNLSRPTEIVMLEANDPVTETRYGKQYRYLRRKVGFGAVAV